MEARRLSFGGREGRGLTRDGPPWRWRSGGDEPPTLGRVRVGERRRPGRGAALG
jgi:hypothetical protein